MKEIKIKIDILKFANAVKEITSTWEDTGEFDPDQDKLLLFRTAAKKIGIPTRDANLVTLPDFIYTIGAPTTPWLGEDEHDPESKAYVGGHGTLDENHDPNSDQAQGGYNENGDILINYVPEFITITKNLTAAQIAEYTAAALEDLKINLKWQTRTEVWKDTYKGHKVFSYVVRKLDAIEPIILTSGPELNQYSGQTVWSYNTIVNGKKQRHGILKSTDSRVDALPKFLEFANVNLAELSENHKWLQTPAPIGLPGDPDPIFPDSFFFNQHESVTLEDRFALNATDHAQFIEADSYNSVNEGFSWLYRINIDANFFNNLAETKKTADESTLKSIRFYGNGLVSNEDSSEKVFPMGVGLTEHLEILASILEAYSKLIKETRRKVPVDLDIQAENLRKIPAQLRAVLEDNKDDTAADLSSSSLDKFEIRVNPKTFKVEDFRVQVEGTDEYTTLRYGVDKLKTSGPLSSPTTVHFFYHAAEILTNIRDAARIGIYPWTDFLTKYRFPVPEIGPEVGGPVTDLLEDMILGGTPEMLNDTFVVEGTQNGKVSPKLLANIEAVAQTTYHEIGEKIFGGKILSANMEKIASLEDFFKQILHKVSISELVTIGFKCLAKYTDIADYLDAACDYAIESLGLKKVETKLLPMIKKKDAKTGAFLEKKLKQFKAQAVSIVQKEASKFVADNAVTEYIEETDQKYFMKNKNSKDVAEALNKGLGDMLRGMKSDVGFCAALLLVIPVVYGFIKEDIDEEKLWKAAKKRWKVFIMDDFPITDFLSEVGNMILQILLNILRDILFALVSKILAQVDKHCSESAEGDLLGAAPGANPYNLENINDLIRNGTTPEKFDETLKTLFLDLGTTVNISKTFEFTDFLDDLSARLTISQLCALMSGAMPRDVELLIRTLIKERYPSLVSFLDDGITIEKIFKAIGSIVDPVACNDAVERYEKEKEMSASCCLDPNPISAKEGLLNEKIGPKKAKAQLDREKIENKEFLQALIPFIIDPHHLDKIIPPLFCTPENPNGMIKESPPSMSHMFDNILATTFYNVEKAFNADIKKFKTMIMGEDVPWVAFDPNSQHETFGDSVSLWLDMLVSMILPWMDDQNEGPEAENYKKNSAMGATLEPSTYIAEKLRQELSPENIDITFHKDGTSDFDGFVISMGDNKQISYFENTGEEPQELFFADPTDPNAILVLAPLSHRTDVMYKAADGTWYTTAVTRGTLSKDPSTDKTPQLEDYIIHGPVSHVYGDIMMPFIDKVLKKSTLDSVYESVVTEVYKRFLDETKQNGFFRRDVFKNLKLDSGAPTQAPVIEQNGNCYAGTLGENPDFMNARAFVDKVNAKKYELECTVEDPESEAVKHAVVQLMARIQAIQAFFKLLFATSLFGFNEVLDSDLVKEMMVDEMMNDLLRAGGNNYNIQTKQRLLYEIQKVAIDIIASKEAKGELLDPLTKEPVKIRTGGEALLFLAKEEIPIVRDLFNKKTKHLIQPTVFFGEDDPLFDRVTYPKFVEMPWNILSAIEDRIGLFPIVITEMGPYGFAGPAPGRYHAIREEEGYNGGLFYERYVNITPKEPSGEIKEELKELQEAVAKLDPPNPSDDWKATKGQIISTLSRIAEWPDIKQFQGAPVSSAEEYSFKGKINLDRAVEYYTEALLPSLDALGMIWYPINPNDATATAQKATLLAFLGSADFVSAITKYKLFLSGVAYTEFFEEITFGVRLCAVIPDSTDVDFEDIKAGYVELAEQLPQQFHKLGPEALKEKTMIIRQDQDSEYLVLPLAELKQSLFVPGTSMEDLLGYGSSRLINSIKFFKKEALREGLQTKKNSGELRIQLQKSAGMKDLLHDVFKMDRFYAAMTANHITAFDNAYPEAVDLFNGTRAHLASLINIMSNLHEYEEPMVNELLDEDAEPWWENMDIDWKMVPVFILQMMASMTDPTWKTDWLWQGGPGPMTILGVAAKWIGDDPYGEEESSKQKDKQLQACNDNLQAKKAAVLELMKGAVDAIAGGTDASGPSFWWSEMTDSERFSILDYHIHDIAAMSVPSLAASQAQFPAETVSHGNPNIYGGYVLTGDPTKYLTSKHINKGIFSATPARFDYTQTGTDGQKWGGMIGGANSALLSSVHKTNTKWAYGTGEGANAAKMLWAYDDEWENTSPEVHRPQRLTKKEIMKFVNEYLAGHYSTLIKPPTYQKEVEDYFNPEETLWPGKDPHLYQLRNMLARFVSGLKFGVYADNHEEQILPLDFLWKTANANKTYMPILPIGSSWEAQDPGAKWGNTFLRYTTDADSDVRIPISFLAAVNTSIKGPKIGGHDSSLFNSGQFGHLKAPVLRIDEKDAEVVIGGAATQYFGTKNLYIEKVTVINKDVTFDAVTKHLGMDQPEKDQLNASFDANVGEFEQWLKDLVGAEELDAKKIADAQNELNKALAMLGGAAAATVLPEESQIALLIKTQDSYWQPGPHGVSEFYVWYPRAFHREDQGYAGAWITLPHLSPHHLFLRYNFVTLNGLDGSWSPPPHSSLSNRLWDSTEQPFGDWDNTLVFDLDAENCFDAPRLSIPHDDPLDLGVGTEDPDYYNYESLWGHAPSVVVVVEGSDTFVATNAAEWDNKVSAAGKQALDENPSDWPLLQTAIQDIEAHKPLTPEQKQLLIKYGILDEEAPALYIPLAVLLLDGDDPEPTDEES